jgi:hypothetical protein
MRTAFTVLSIVFAIVTPAMAQSDIEMETRGARALAGQLLQPLGATLMAELAANGPEGAIGVCKQVAPDIAGSLSRQTGSKVARVSLRTRNAMLGAPDAWEQAVLADFDRKAAAGDKPETLERAEFVDEPAGRYFRYMKAIPVQPMCLACHGAAENIPDGVKQKLALDYPKDRATGYAAGQIRGAVTVKKPLD